MVGVLFAGHTIYSVYINPVLTKCWASVVDGGPTLDQHWVDVSCLQVYVISSTLIDTSILSFLVKHGMLKQCWFNVGTALKTVEQLIAY